MPDLTGELQTVLTAAAFAPITKAFLRITGPDAPRWLNGMVTNNVQALGPGEGSYNFLLNAQGRIQGTATIYREPFCKEPTFLFETDTAQVDALQQLLDKFIIMDDVELTPGLHIGDTPTVASPVGMTLVGPQCRDLLAKLLTARKDFAKLVPLPPGTATPAKHEGDDVLLLTSPAQKLLATEVWCRGRGLLNDLYRKLDFYRIPQVSPDTLEQLRILEALPHYGTDIRDRDLPQETNQSHALHFAKGCYVGQEIVERIRSRGQVHRLLTPFRLEGTLPTTLPTALEVNGKVAGELTSATSIPTTEGPVTLALGYARREFLDTHANFSYPGGTAHPRAAGKLS